MNSAPVICFLVFIGVCQSSLLPSYGSGGGAGNNEGAGTGEEVDEGTGSLEGVIPGIPGQDYPILAEVPDTSFSCEGKIEAGYYADTEAQCQVFHICIPNEEGSLGKTSFLCHNGTLFNQELFTCDLWANVDCSAAEGLYSKNEELAAARAAVTVAASSAGESDGTNGAGSEAAGAAYGAPVPSPVLGVYGAPSGRAARFLGTFTKDMRNKLS